MDLDSDLFKQWGTTKEEIIRSSAMKTLFNEYVSLLKDPTEGFIVKMKDPLNWEVGIFGPPSTPYWGGYYKLVVSFTKDYPFEPPKLRFKDFFLHPNVYPNGLVCMSILHGTSDNVPGLEEKWKPSLSVRTVLLSLIAVISNPNPDSPANVTAAKMFRAWKDLSDKSYLNAIIRTVEKSKLKAAEEGVKIPTTVEEYCQKPSPSEVTPPERHSPDSSFAELSSDCSDSSEDESGPSQRSIRCSLSPKTSPPRKRRKNNRSIK